MRDKDKDYSIILKLFREKNNRKKISSCESVRKPFVKTPNEEDQ